MEHKNIEVYFSEDSYYGITLNFWTTDEKTTVDEFVQDLKEAFKEEIWLQQHMDVGDFMDFIDTLSNKSVNENLFKNVTKNVIWLEEIKYKSYETGVNDIFQKIVEKNYNSYSNTETISVIGLLCPLLKKEEDFKDWFKNEIKNNDEILFYALFDDEESLTRMNAVIDKRIEQQQNQIKYYKSQILGYEKEIDKLKNQKEELNRKNKN